MTRLILIIFSICCLFLSSYAQTDKTPNGWKVFAKVKFEPKLIEEVDQYYLIPQFDEKIKSFEGKRVELKGFVMPFDYGDDPMIILSKYPYSSCFFCGAAGPESVAEILFDEKPRAFKGDEQIVIVGTLRLNSEDIEHMNFIVEDSKILGEQ